LPGVAGWRAKRTDFCCRRQAQPETELRPDIRRGPGGPETVRVQGVRQARAEQVASLSDALFAGPQVLGLQRGVQQDRHAAVARQETTPHDHPAILLRDTRQRVAPRHRAVPRPAGSQTAVNAQTDRLRRVTRVLLRVRYTHTHTQCITRWFSTFLKLPEKRHIFQRSRPSDKNSLLENRTIE